MSKINTEKNVCASSDMPKCWEDINFNVAEKHVKKLQMRIAMAQEENAFGKLTTIQNILMHSFYAKALAVKIVTTNKGKRTSGIDGVLWNTPDEKWQAIADLNRRGYKSKPLKRIYIPKDNGKKRPLSIPTMKDRAMNTLYKFALEPIAEITGDVNSYGFRKDRCTQDAITRCIDVLTSNPNLKWILEGDIKACFDHINHKWVMEHIPMDKEILQKFLENGYIEHKKYNPIAEGIPQGGSISTVICNMVLDGLEKVLDFPRVHFVRYADDFVIFAENEMILEQSVIPLIEEFLSVRGLNLSPDKTAVTHIEDGFDFLGWNVSNDENGQLLIVTSRKNVDALMDKVGKILSSELYISDERLRILLRRIICGWINYHKDIVMRLSIYNVGRELLYRMYQYTEDRRLIFFLGSFFPL